MSARGLTASSRVATDIRAAIDDGTLLPGEHIRQEWWAERLGVSRVPIREALKELSSEGLLDHDPNRGYFVQRMDPAEIRQIYRLRQLIEPEILGALEPFTDDEIDELRRLSRAALDAFRAGDVPGGFELERTLHATIWRHCPHKVIVREAARLWSRCDAYRIRTVRSHPDLLGFVDLLEGRHRTLIGALATHDLDTVRDLVIEDRQIMLDATDRIIGPPPPRR